MLGISQFERLLPSPYSVGFSYIYSDSLSESSISTGYLGYTMGSILGSPHIPEIILLWWSETCDMDCKCDRKTTSQVTDQNHNHRSEGIGLRSISEPIPIEKASNELLFSPDGL
jgi:hypothetical protein